MNDYQPKPIDTSGVELDAEIRQLCEQLAENAHDVWARQRLQDGWTYGPQRDDQTKQHPCLLSYAELPESEKDYDRQTAMQTLKAVAALGYRIASSGPHATGPEPVKLDDQALPAAFHIADQNANRAQTRFMGYVQLHVLVLLLATLAQALASLHSEIADFFAITTPAFTLDWDWEQVWYRLLSGLVAGILLTRLWLHRRPDKRWRQYRAEAEQIKHLCWLYCMGLTTTIPTSLEHTPQMQALRKASAVERREVYLQQRLGEQLRWYQSKAAWHQRRDRCFKVLKILAELLALAAAGCLWFKVAESFKWTALMYPCLSIAAASLAWVSYKRYAETATSYQHTSEQLLNILVKPPADLAELVENSEQILCREQQLWLARRIVTKPEPTEAASDTPR